jgi:hypothetical protein
LVRIAGPDETEVESVRFQRNQELIDGFHADHVRRAVRVTFDQGVELIHENGSAKRQLAALGQQLGARLRRITVIELPATLGGSGSSAIAGHEQGAVTSLPAEVEGAGSGASTEAPERPPIGVAAVVRKAAGVEPGKAHPTALTASAPDVTLAQRLYAARRRAPAARSKPLAYRKIRASVPSGFRPRCLRLTARCQMVRGEFARCSPCHARARESKPAVCRNNSCSDPVDALLRSTRLRVHRISATTGYTAMAISPISAITTVLSLADMGKNLGPENLAAAGYIDLAADLAQAGGKLALALGPAAVEAPVVYLTVDFILILEQLNGFGLPDTGGAFTDGKSNFDTTAGILQQAAPDGSQWSGDAEVNYNNKNVAQQTLTQQMADADQAMATILATQAAQVERVRETLAVFRGLSSSGGWWILSEMPVLLC